MYGDAIQTTPSKDWELQRVFDWKLKLCWWPKRCYLTGKKLWSCYAYHGERWITGPGEPVVEHYWIDKTEFLIWNLKGRQ